MTRLNLGRHSKRRHYGDRLADMRKRYARMFGIKESDVQDRVWPDGDIWVFSEKHPELPRWTTGEGYR